MVKRILAALGIAILVVVTLSIRPATSARAYGGDCPGFMAAGSVHLVPVGCIVSGDVSTSRHGHNWHFQADNRESTGTIVVVERHDVLVYARYDAYASDSSLGQVEAAMRSPPNCVYGCRHVHVVYV